METAELEAVIAYWDSCCGQVVDLPLIPEPASSTDHERTNGERSSGATNGHVGSAQDNLSHGSAGIIDGARELEVGSVPVL